MKTLKTLTIVLFALFISSCTADDALSTQNLEQPIDSLGCDCRQMHFENQVINGGMNIQLVFTGYDEWQQIECDSANATIDWKNDGVHLYSPYVTIDEQHSYRWECKSK